MTGPFDATWPGLYHDPLHGTTVYFHPANASLPLLDTTEPAASLPDNVPWTDLMPMLPAFQPHHHVSLVNLHHPRRAGGGQVLLLRYGPRKALFGGAWGHPGGKATAGETFLDAACREFTEETGLPVYRPGAPKQRTRSSAHVDGLPVEAFRAMGMAYVRHARVPLDLRVALYHVTVPAHLDPHALPVQLTEEHDAYVWADTQDLTSLGLMPACLPFLQRSFGHDLENL